MYKQCHQIETIVTLAVVLTEVSQFQVTATPFHDAKGYGEEA